MPLLGVVAGAGADGTPYRACMHVGVTFAKHDDGTLLCRFVVLLVVVEFKGRFDVKGAFRL